MTNHNHFTEKFPHFNYSRFLSFCPRGDDEEFHDGVSFYLCLAEADSTEFKVKFTVGVIGNKGNKEYNLEQLGEVFDNGFGVTDLLKQDELFNLDRGHFIHGKLTLYCNVSEEYKRNISFLN